MFELEYCSNPEIGELHSSGIKFDYQYDVEFDSKLKTIVFKFFCFFLLSFVI